MAVNFDDAYAAALQSAADGVADRTGVKRRHVDWADAQPITPTISDPEREVQASGLRFRGNFPTALGAGRALLGDEAGAQDAYRSAQRLEERAAAVDSDVSASPGDWNDVGSALAGIRKAAIGSAPDMALAVGGGLLARGVARRAVVDAETRALARAPSAAVQEAAARIQPSAVAASPAVAARQGQEALRKAAGRAARADAGVMARADRAGTAGFLAGGAVAGLPGQLGEQREFLQEHTGQGDAAKVGAAALAASALDALPMERLLGRAFTNPVAKQALAQDAGLLRQLGARAATAGKNVAGQAASEGATEATQALVQRAGQKWVDQNVELFSRDALNDYAANAILGGILGGGMGAAVDLPQGIAGATADTGRWAWDKSGDLRAKVRENIAKPWFRGEPRAAAPAAGEAPATPGGAAEMMARARATLRRGMDAAGPMAERARSAAAEGLQKVSDALRRDRQNDASADEAMDWLQNSMTQNLDDSAFGVERPGTKGRNFTESWAAAQFAPGYIESLGPVDGPRLIKTIGDFAAGRELARPQATLLARVLNDEASGVTPQVAKFIRGWGPIITERLSDTARAGDGPGPVKTQKYGDDRDVVTREDESIGDELEADRELTEALNVPTTDREVSATDRANSARVGMRAAGERGDVDARTEQRDAGRAAFAQAREELTRNLLTTENRSTQKASQHYDARKAKPGFVELAEKQDVGRTPGAVVRGQLVNLGMLIQRQKAAMRREGTADENISDDAALLRGLSELQQAGLPINPDTLTHGRIFDEREGKKGEVVATISKKIVERLKNDAALRRGTTPLPRSDRVAEPDSDALDAEFADNMALIERDNPEPANAADDEQRSLVAREAPKGVHMGDGQFVPSQGSPVSDVSFHNPHEQTIAQWREERRKLDTPKALRDLHTQLAEVRWGDLDSSNARVRREAEARYEAARAAAYKTKAGRELLDAWERYANHEGGLPEIPAQGTPAERAALDRKFGEMIGAASIAAEVEAGTMNPKRAEATRARLMAKNSDLPARYLQRAVRGQFDGGGTGASVRDMPSDKNAASKRRDDRITRVEEEGDAGREFETRTPEQAKQREEAESGDGPSSRADTLENRATTLRYAGEDKDLRKRADKNRRAAKFLAAPRPGTAARKAWDEAQENVQRRHEANRARLTLDKGRTVADRAPDMGDGLGHPKKQPAKEEAPRESNPAPGKKRVIKKKDLANEDTGAEGIASTPPGKHDHANEATFINRVLRALGYTTEQAPNFTVTRLDRPGGGRHWYTRSKIELSDDLKGRERVEVLAHEIGHAIVAAEISKATGVPVEQLMAPDGSGISPDLWPVALAKANPELFKALRADFDKWRAIHRPDTSYVAMRMGRSGVARAAAQRRAGRRLGRAGESTMQAAGDKTAYQLSMNEWMADNIGRALLQNKHGQGLAQSFFGKIADQIKRAYDLLFKGKGAAKWKAAPSIQKWVDDMFDANVAAVQQATGQTVSVKQAEQAVKGAVAAAAPAAPPAPPSTPGKPPEDFDALMDYVRNWLPPDARNVLERTFSTGANDKLIRQLFDGIPEVLDLLRDSKQGMEARIAAGYMAWKLGVIKPGPNTEAALSNLLDRAKNMVGLATGSDYAQRILGDFAAGRIAARVKERGMAGYDFKANEARARGGLQKAVDAIGNIKERLLAPLNRAIESNTQRATESGIPAYRKISALIHKPQGAAGEDRGMAREAVHKTAEFADKASRIVKDLTPFQQRRVLDLLQRATPDEALDSDKRSPAVRDAVRGIRALMDESLDYMKEGGVKVTKTPNYYPVQLDIHDDFSASKLAGLLARKDSAGKPKFEAAIRDFFAEIDEDGNKVPSTKPFKDLVDDLVEGARESGMPATTAEGTPNFTGANQRIMRFIYNLGDAKDIKDFADLQVKDMAESLARYFDPMVKRTEYARRFGDDGARLQTMLADMEKQGATPEQVQHARDMVSAALGTYGQDASPVLKMISPGLAKKFSGDKTRATIDGLQAYQNARLLPLSLLSSLVDPMGIAVRTGGDFGATWKGFKAGMKTLTDKSSKQQQEDMLRMLGASSDMATQEALNQMFGGANSKLSAKVNEFVFKWNGMSSWVRATRYMALNAAHEFLLNHAGRSTNEHSERYLEELGLKASDVQASFSTDGTARVKLLNAQELASASKEEKARDLRVKKALMEFVDSAILRPNSQQTPLWHSDPFMGLITQYKSFAYAFYDQITGRISTELNNGNAKVLLAAASYMPVVIMAEMLRNVLQGDTEDTEEWGPSDWASLGLERSGLLAPKLDLLQDTVEDVERHRMPGASQIGPTWSQADNVIDSFQGRRDLGGEFEAALPASALYRKWNDGPRTAAGEV